MKNTGIARYGKAATGEALVVQANSLARARYQTQLSAHAVRLMAVAIAKLNRDSDMLDGVCISVGEMRDIFSAYRKTQTYGSIVKESAVNIMSLKAEILPGTGAKADWKLINIISDVEMRRGQIFVTFHPDTRDLLLRLAGHFTTYQLKQIGNLNTTPQLLLFQWARSYIHKGSATLDPAALRSTLNLEPSTYPEARHLRQRVLDPTIEKINELTDITMSYKEIRNGRSIVMYEFQISLKAGAPLTVFEIAATKMLAERGVAESVASQIVRDRGAVEVVRGLAAANVRFAKPGMPDVRNKPAYLVALLRGEFSEAADPKALDREIQGLTQQYRRIAFKQLQIDEQSAHIRAFSRDFLKPADQTLWERFQDVDAHPVLLKAFDSYLKNFLDPLAPAIILTTSTMLPNRQEESLDKAIKKAAP